MISKISIGFGLLCLLFPFLLIAQSEPKYLVVTRAHFDLETDYTIDQWKAVEKEYFDKVTMKNDLIAGSNVLVHYYTEDNSEVLFATVYRAWDDIEKAATKNDELAKAAWPDEAARKAFFKKQSAMYSSLHSDEIYSIMPGTKSLASTATTEQIYYIRTSHRHIPEGGSADELKTMTSEYQNNVTLKNPLIKGYYPSRHLWGADGREVVQTFVYSSLTDLEKSEDEQTKLVNAHWPDEKKRKEFLDKLSTYRETGMAMHFSATCRNCVKRLCLVNSPRQMKDCSAISARLYPEG